MRRNKIVIIIILIICVIGLILVFLFFNNKKIKTEINNVSGIVDKINNNFIILKINGVDPILATQNNREFYYMKFLVNKNTEINKFYDKIKSKTQFQKEQYEFNNKIKKLKNEKNNILEFNAPSWYIQKKIEFNNLKEGDKVKVYYHSIDKNSKKNIIIANKIIVSLDLSKKFLLPDEVKNKGEEIKIIGELIDFTSDKLYLKFVDFSNIDNTSEESLITKIFTFNFNKNIKVTQKIKKTEDQFYKEQSEYNKQLYESLNNNIDSKLITPNWFIEKNMNFNNLKIGSDIVVYAEKNNNSLVIKKIEYIIKD